MYLPTDDVLATALLRVERDGVGVREAVRAVCGTGVTGTAMEVDAGEALHGDWSVQALRAAVAQRA